MAAINLTFVSNLVRKQHVDNGQFDILHIKCNLILRFLYFAFNRKESIKYNPFVKRILLICTKLSVVTL